MAVSDRTRPDAIQVDFSDEEETKKHPTEALGKLASALLYFVVAIAMGIINKAALQQYPYSNMLLLIQMVLTVAFVQVGSLVGVSRVRSISWSQLMVIIPLAAFYNANVAFALAGLQKLNIPMYQTLKRLTPCVICIVNGVSGRGWPSRNVAASVLVIASGTVIAGLGDFDFDIRAYGYALTSCLLQAAYLVLAERGGEKGLSSTELMFYNSILSILPLLAVAHLTGESGPGYSELLRLSNDASFVFLIAGTAAMGSLLNFSLFLCASVNSALTTTVVGVMKAVVTTGLGFFVLGGARVTTVNFSGIVVNTAGGCLYTWAKYVSKAEKNTPT